MIRSMVATPPLLWLGAMVRGIGIVSHFHVLAAPLVVVASTAAQLGGVVSTYTRLLSYTTSHTQECTVEQLDTIILPRTIICYSHMHRCAMQYCLLHSSQQQYAYSVAATSTSIVLRPTTRQYHSISSDVVTAASQQEFYVPYCHYTRARNMSLGE